MNEDGWERIGWGCLFGNAMSYNSIETLKLLVFWFKKVGFNIEKFNTKLKLLVLCVGTHKIQDQPGVG